MERISPILILFASVVCMVTCDEHIVQICEGPPTLDCIREYFEEKGQGVGPKEPKNTVHYSNSYFPIYLAKDNCTIVLQDVDFTFNEVTVEQFHYDETTKNLVLCFKLPKFHCDAPNSLIAVDQVGREPIVFEESLVVTYPVAWTAVIPCEDDGTISSNSIRETIFSGVCYEQPEMQLGPKFSESTDPAVVRVYNSIVSDLDPTLQEIWLTKSSQVGLSFIQTNIFTFDNIKPDEQFKYTPEKVAVLKSVLDKDPNDESGFVYPCDGSEDLRLCIAEFASDFGHCQAVVTPDDHPVKRDRYTTYIPSLHLTAQTNNATLSSLRGKVENFYVNNNTNNVVVSIRYEGLVMESPYVPLIINRRCEQSKIVIEYNKDTYPCIITSVTNLANNGLTSEAAKSSYVSTRFTGVPTFEYEQTQEDAADPEVQQLNEDVVENALVIGQEIFTTEGIAMWLASLQKYVCDFNIALTDELF